MKHTQQSGAKVYNPFTLSLYDWWVLNISNKYAWKCPTDTRLLPFFLHHMGETHLDIGVGTGYYLKHAPATHAISLMDLNPDSLKIAASRVGVIRKSAPHYNTMFSTRSRRTGMDASIPFRCTIFCTAYLVRWQQKRRQLKMPVWRLNPTAHFLAPRFWAKRFLTMLLARN